MNEKSSRSQGAGRNLAAGWASRRTAGESKPASSSGLASTLASTRTRRKKSPEDIVQAWMAGASLIEEAKREKSREAKARQESEAAAAARGGGDGRGGEDDVRGNVAAKAKASFEAYSRTSDEARFSILE